ncbi:MAG TPA: hypothetical protein PL009_11050 [Flavipsychrobacter sp.]|nr:hypothetical protein [Flavipsychrobacter sp.]
MKSLAQNALREEIKEHINHADERTLRLIHAIIGADKDWWDETSTEEKASINRGLKDIKAEKVASNEHVMKKYGKWLAK